ncbi:BREX-1 system adenine-specific DNA-methyltransferase PglX [Lysinibacillus sp. 2017]|uniref:BREX-1 system adenine-specific DNA-methyltransferase PglX n=1 Tax=unclassified Lysinibacillus TaxID=2636778 RepID=UPI000D5297A0|nr:MULTISPECIES: BREX-1 system adenine-specific DNA-methyltransferase PglX [unclassified Lysinibacillus]AWE08581.1 BREX-1 system adenine-specific DNA-methyltransferase PglX [Lysinibacillus sp. 2017]TGN35671.1 BREX-1 system adenine-specific DNA-methyltransferase PglX [Lysinibacillus sp. S2017]
MNKSALKSFATEARLELLEKIQLQARKLGITPDAIQQASLESSDAIYIDSKQLLDVERKQRNKLIARINEIGYDRVMEEAAYTWFNRFIALRYMEVNDYLPTKVRVLSSVNPDSTEPDMFKEALNLDLPIDKELVYNLKIENEMDELFKYLIKIHCNDLNRYMPFMFETIEGYTEVLFPEGLLGTDTFVRKMTDVCAIPEEDWTKVEIVGWLYQFYNTELNEIVYDGEMSKKRVPKELLPAATQLFTPEWAVKYMVENSLGRYWLEKNPDPILQEGFQYYLQQHETESNFDLVGDLASASINLEHIKVIDPCMGSGHILVYAFDVLMKIYESKGYVPREAASLILKNNLFGLEIDDRAYQIACFAVMMKARKYNRRIFRENIELNLCTIVDSNVLVNEDFSRIIDEKQLDKVNYLVKVFENAKEYGSILNLEYDNYDELATFITQLGTSDNYDIFNYQKISDMQVLLPKLIKQAKIMSQKYEIVITNPPYLGSSRMSPLLDNYVKEYYPETKSDLSIVMFEKSLKSYLQTDGYISFITTTSWMFLKSFEKFRSELLKNVAFTSLVDFGTELFDGKVGHNPIVSWINKKSAPRNKMIAVRLVDYCYSKRYQKETEFFNLANRSYPNPKSFGKIIGSPIAYWFTNNIFDIFADNSNIGKVSYVKKGMFTGDNNKFIRFWYETSVNSIGFNLKSLESAFESKKKWFPTKKGGGYRKWYGNDTEIVAMDKSSYEEIENAKGHRSPMLYFKPSISWSSVTSGDFSCRYSDYGYINNTASMSLFYKEMDIEILLAILNSKLVFPFLNQLSPTLNYTAGDIERIPLIEIDRYNKEIIKKIVTENLRISKKDWDAFENSWDFKKHSLLNSESIQLAYEKWENDCENRFHQLKENEELLNKLLIELYELQDELSPNVAERDVTISKANLEKDIKSFISYAVGCFLGRYSLKEEGLIYAGGNFDVTRYKADMVDEDNIIPVLSGAHFKDDIVSKFIDFIRVVYNIEIIEENLNFVADALGRKKNETAQETIRRYFLNDFYKDHIQTYKKRPIYWLFTSGKEKAFNCLIYMHRYDKTTLSRIRTDYVHEVQNRMDAERTDLLNIINGDSTVKEIAAAKKELKSLEKKIDELKKYDELLHHMADQQIEIDLDEGVKHNYELFKGLVAPIK